MTKRRAAKHRNTNGKNRKGSSSGINTPYDDAYQTMVHDCTRLLLPVINEVFHKNYSGEEEIVRHPNDHYITGDDGEVIKRITDSFFSVYGETREEFLLECQSTPDGSMLVRIFEYVTQAGLDSAKLCGNTLRVKIPHAAVIFLRSSRETPDIMTIDLFTPGGDISFAVPVMKMKSYTRDELFEKTLFPDSILHLQLGREIEEMCERHRRSGGSESRF